VQEKYAQLGVLAKSTDSNEDTKMRACVVGTMYKINPYLGDKADPTLLPTLLSQYNHLKANPNNSDIGND